ncbi:PssE/Cps14G family polysaccharide biosynthesis glycosyltransferase [Terribacillus saccharophilus]|uniref:PssE/Cps14G family polysaccharide biosynthesis glycosyltransferase n=1 Tax=Terribacillus saccharophilus TaxID=361277 RepID=UPI00381DCD92
MIFVTVGTQKFPFNRLFKELDILIDDGIITEEVYAQIGYSTYQPKNYTAIKLLDESSMINKIKESSIVITHAGTSSIIKSLKLDKKVIVVPREMTYGEHVDNHQLEITQSFADRNLIDPVYNILELKEKLLSVHHKVFSKYKFDNIRLLNSIRNDIDSFQKKSN